MQDFIYSAEKPVNGRDEKLILLVKYVSTKKPTGSLRRTLKMKLCRNPMKIVGRIWSFFGLVLLRTLKKGIGLNPGIGMGIFAFKNDNHYHLLDKSSFVRTSITSDDRTYCFLEVNSSELQKTTLPVFKASSRQLQADSLKRKVNLRRKVAVSGEYYHLKEQLGISGSLLRMFSRVWS